MVLSLFLLSGRHNYEADRFLFDYLKPHDILLEFALFAHSRVEQNLQVNTSGSPSFFLSQISGEKQSELAVFHKLFSREKCFINSLVGKSVS